MEELSAMKGIGPHLAMLTNKHGMPDAIAFQEAPLPNPTPDIRFRLPMRASSRLRARSQCQDGSGAVPLTLSSRFSLCWDGGRRLDRQKQTKLTSSLARQLCWYTGGIDETGREYCGQQRSQTFQELALADEMKGALQV